MGRPARVLDVEHVLYPLAVEWLARGMAVEVGAPPLRAVGFVGGREQFRLDGGASDAERAIREALGVHGNQEGA